MFSWWKKKQEVESSAVLEQTVFVNLPIKSVFVGNLKTDCSVRLDCDFKGDVITTGRIIIARDARVEGNIKCVSALIQGQIRGNIVALESLALKVPAHIKGNILTREIYIEPGVVIDGVYKIMEDKN